MQPGTSHSGHRSPGRRTALHLFAAGVPLTGPGDSANPARCISALCLNFQLSTVNSGRCAQPPCFDNLPHSATTSQKSPLCFHIHTNTFSCNSFLLTSIQKHRGCHPQFANSCVINSFFGCLFTPSSQGRTTGLANPNKVELFPPRDGLLSRERVRAVLAARVKTRLENSEGNNIR